MKNRKMKKLVASRFSLLLLTVAVLFGCSGGTEIGNPQSGGITDISSPLEVSSFQSASELEDYLKEQYAANIQAAQYVALAEVDAPADAGESPVSDGSGYSGVNVQESGVGESDKALTDGQYLFVAGEDRVSIVSAAPVDAMAVVASVPVAGAVDSLYLYKDLLVILHRPVDYDGDAWIGALDSATMAVGLPYWLPVDVKTGVLLVDVSDRTQPQVIKTIELDGSLTTTRLIDGRLILVQQFLPNLPPLKLYYDGTEADKQAVIQSNRVALAAKTLDDLAPSYRITNGDGLVADAGLLVGAADFYRPEDPSGGSLVTVTTVLLDDPGTPLQSAGLVADVQHVYASARSLYLAAGKWDASVGVSGEAAREMTAIHQFTLESDRAVWVAGGSVGGHVLNQFSFGEYNGVLRLATTTGWGSERLNHVYCLAPEDGYLKRLGSVTGLAPGEAVYAARFIGDRGYLVTFVKVDPLYTLDLSDPANPRLVGELKVPGYSDYIHLLDDTHLLTIGKSVYLVNGTAWYQGLQLSIFDISDFANPLLVHAEKIGDRGTYSEALYNHKAFTFWPASNLLAFPVALYEHQATPDMPWNFGTYRHTGLHVYRVSGEAGIDPLGQIVTHTAGAGYYHAWMRGIFIDQHVYAVTVDAVHAAQTDDISGGVYPLELTAAP
jgi:inhibitor of cysteine peptidase